MINISKNDELIKNDIIKTPNDISSFIYDKVKRKPYKNILDVGCFDGSLSKPFKSKKNNYINGVDVVNTFEDKFDNFIFKDYLLCNRDDFKEIDLIVSNPPFSDLLAFKFIEHTFKLFGEDIPLICIVPNYILDNSKKRGLELNNYNITKIVKLNQYSFKDVAIHCSIIFFNINFKTKNVYEYYYKKTEIKGRRRTLYMTQEQEEFLKNNNIKNFSKFVKDSIKTNFKDFPN